MNPNSFGVTNNQELGDLFLEDVRMILANIFFWLTSMALISCPVWMPLVIESILRR